MAARALDLFEINKAFAIVTLTDMRDLDLPAKTVNVNGGACARGLNTGPSQRGRGCAHSGDAGARLAGAGRKAVRGNPVHRWGRGHAALAVEWMG